MAFRRRPSAEFEQTQSEAGPRIVTLDSLIGGYNGYTSPDLLSPQFWAGASNVHAGQFGTIRRARWAPVLNSTTSGYTIQSVKFNSMFGYAPPTFSPRLLFDRGAATNPRWIWTVGGAATTVPYSGIDPTLLQSPVMRIGMASMVLETNGVARAKALFLSSVFQGFLWGIDAPDSSIQTTIFSGFTRSIVAATGAARAATNIVTITTTAAHGILTGAYVQISGVTDTSFNTPIGVAVQITSTGTTTFTYFQTGPTVTSGSGTVTVGITQTVGRSYQWAWENANTGHVSAPSPAGEYTKFVSQYSSVDCIQPGTISHVNGSTLVNGVATAFSSAWVGRQVWANTAGSIGQIASVQSAIQLTLTINTAPTFSTQSFQVSDQQATHVRLYATADGGAIYFLIGRNVYNIAATNLPASGLEFQDTANSQPPNAPFSNEIAQTFNVPPPIGSFLQDYQGRILVYGVSAALQTFFYSNIETTIVGQPPESFAPLNTVTLPIGDGQINGMANLPTGLCIWSNRQDMFKLTGLLTDNVVASAQQLGATIQRLPYKIGAASPYATAVTPLGAMWLSSDREVWLFTDHYAPKNVGKPIQDILNRINGARLQFARVAYYKRGDRSWLALAIALDSSTTNNKLCLLDLDLLASNGQPSFFTFDMATNQPTWYLYDVNCESIATAYDNSSINHLLTGDIDLITDVDWQPGYYTVSAEQNVTGNVLLHAFGNEDPHMVKTFEWMRALTNQVPKNLAAQGWAWAINAFDDDQFVIGVNPLVTNLIPCVDSNSNPLFLEYSPAKFRFGGVRPVKGRRFQIQTTFPSGPGAYELRGFEVSYTNLVGR